MIKLLAVTILAFSPSLPPIQNVSHLTCISCVFAAGCLGLANRQFFGGLQRSREYTTDELSVLLADSFTNVFVPQKHIDHKEFHLPQPNNVKLVSYKNSGRRDLTGKQFREIISHESEKHFDGVSRIHVRHGCVNKLIRRDCGLWLTGLRDNARNLRQIFNPESGCLAVVDDCEVKFQASVVGCVMFRIEFNPGDVQVGSRLESVRSSVYE